MSSLPPGAHAQHLPRPGWTRLRGQCSGRCLGQGPRQPTAWRMSMDVEGDFKKGSRGTTKGRDRAAQFKLGLKPRLLASLAGFGCFFAVWFCFDVPSGPGQGSLQGGCIGWRGGGCSPDRRGVRRTLSACLLPGWFGPTLGGTWGPQKARFFLLAPCTEHFGHFLQSLSPQNDHFGRFWRAPFSAPVPRPGRKLRPSKMGGGKQVNEARTGKGMDLVSVAFYRVTHTITFVSH